MAETREADGRFGPFVVADEDLVQRLRRAADDVRRSVPDCVGISVTLRELEVTFTLVATDERAAVLDAMQYLDGGPCVDAVDLASATTSHAGDPLDEERWRLFAAARSAEGIASTLSLPFRLEGVIAGAFNLYASSAHAFDGHHHAVAEVLGAWSAEAVTNADLGFGTRELARRAPDVLRDRVGRVVDVLARRTGLSPERWEERLRLAAVRGGVSLTDLVTTIAKVLGEAGDLDEA